MVLRAWISQLVMCDGEAFRITFERWEDQDGVSATDSDVLEIFQAITRNVHKCTFIVDGLDECAWNQEETWTNNCKSPMGFFTSIKQAVEHTRTRIMIFSRDEPEIRHAYYSVFGDNDGSSPIEYRILPQDVRADASLFSQLIVNEKLRNKSDAQKEHLSQKMVDRCDGMFLWMKMLGDELRGGMNISRLEKTIEKAPKKVEHLYDRNWDRVVAMDEKDSNRALSILRWAAFALRPLTILELTEALLIADEDSCDDLLVDELPDSIDEEYIRSEILGPCGSLLETRKAADTDNLGSMTLHVAHFSVKQYILCKLPSHGFLVANEQLRHSNEAVQNNILAKMCLRYLNIPIVWQRPLQLTSGPVPRAFLQYAVNSWPDHAKMDGFKFEEVTMLINDFFEPGNPRWQSWIKWIDPTLELEGVAFAGPLFYASSLGLEDTVVHLLNSSKVDIDDADEPNRTALQGACLAGHRDIVRLLLDRGADITVADRTGRTALSLASNKGHVDVVRLLLEHGADVTVPNNDGWAPLNSASNEGHVDVVQLLLEHGADVAALSNDGWTPLNSAADSGHVDVVRLLLEHSASVAAPDNNGRTPLNLAASNGHVNVVRLLLEHGADVTVPDNNGRTPLNSAADGGHVDVVRLLLGHGADATVAKNNGWTPLKSAADNGHVDVIRLLLEHGVDVTAPRNDGWTSLKSAACNGHADVVRLLLEHGVDVTVPRNDGWTPLNLAASNGHADVIRLLLKHGVDVTAPKNDGWTSLKSAACNGHADVVRLLLEHGVDVTVSRNDGWTPLNSAAYKGYPDVVRLLLEHGADVTVPISGWTPLHLAAYNGHVDVVRLLVNSGADVKRRHAVGRTSFMLAAQNGHDTVVEFLITKVDPNERDHYGSTALSIAARNGHTKVVKLLLNDIDADLHSLDCFGRSIQWWAGRCGNPETAETLHEYAIKNGISAANIDAFSDGEHRTILTQTSRWCDVCTLVIPEGSIYHRCIICNGGDFDVCSPCFEVGASCLGQHHTLLVVD